MTTKTRRRRCRAIDLHTSLKLASGKARVQCRKKEAEPGAQLCRMHQTKVVPHDVNERGPTDGVTRGPSE